jgi:hypothetical protein
VSSIANAGLSAFSFSGRFLSISSRFEGGLGGRCDGGWLFGGGLVRDLGDGVGAAASPAALTLAPALTSVGAGSCTFSTDGEGALDNGELLTASQP